jgi:hypothetical protein
LEALASLVDREGNTGVSSAGEPPAALADGVNNDWVVIVVVVEFE